MSQHDTGLVQRLTDFGPAMPELGWVPAPRYLLRRDRVLAAAQRLPRGRVLEIGCGAGTLLDDLAHRGYECWGIESSPSALRLARHIEADNAGVHISDDLDAMRPLAPFDMLMSFEVLEHIDDDVATLTSWREYLKPGGWGLFAVPSHMSRWSATDVWAGHFRRYERPAFVALLERAGFTIERMECYGFPLSNLIEPLRGAVHARKLRQQRNSQPDMARQTAESGSDRGIETRLFGLLASPPGRLLMAGGIRLQRHFLEGERGTGYLAVCRRRD